MISNYLLSPSLFKRSPPDRLLPMRGVTATQKRPLQDAEEDLRAYDKIAR